MDSEWLHLETDMDKADRSDVVSRVMSSKRRVLKLFGLASLAVLASLGLGQESVVKASSQPDVVTNTTNTFSTTTTPLPGAGTATLPPLNCQSADEVGASVYTDMPGTLYVETSQDSTNWRVSDSVPVVANAPVNRIYAVTTPYMRLRYVNGSVSQTVFELSAVLR